MSELIDNARKRKQILKKLILQLHEGVAPETVKEQLIKLLGKVPYGDVVEVEQELIKEGLPQYEILKLCDIHSQALRGIVEEEPKKGFPTGHPVDTFRKENEALAIVLENLKKGFEAIEKLEEDQECTAEIEKVRELFNSLADVEKHYLRKENLLFPFLEKYGITGPTTVMWGKHDEVREKLEASLEALEAIESITAGEGKALIEMLLKPAAEAIEEMIFKENEILLPISMDKLTEQEWYAIARQSDEYGYCLYAPEKEWKPEGIKEKDLVPEGTSVGKRINLSSGSMTPEELEAILNTIPFDITFVDRDDRVRYFSQGKERIFARSKAILGRKVQRCHPPSSVHIVQRIIDDFRSGKEDQASFWINLKGQFIIIEYFALRNKDGEYLGTLEVSQNLTEKRKLEGEQRLLNYKKKGNKK